MKMICAPSHVMREGRDLNQHGQAGRHEQASSSSPATFHAGLASALAAVAALAGVMTLQMATTKMRDGIEVIFFISFLWFKVGFRQFHGRECNSTKESVKQG